LESLGCDVDWSQRHNAEAFERFHTHDPFGNRIEVVHVLWAPVPADVENARPAPSLGYPTNGPMEDGSDVTHQDLGPHQHQFGAPERSPGRLKRMPIKLENVAIAVRDLEETIAFFTDLGLTVLGRDTVSGEWADTAVGLDGNHAKIAMLQTPDGNGRLELFEYIHPDAIETEPTLPNEIGMHRVAFTVDDLDAALEIAARHGCKPLRGVATYEDFYKLTYLRGPSGIIVMLAEELKKG
jgi:glyoxylase I family protein